MTENQIVGWIIYLYFVAPVGYCFLSGWSRCGWRGGCWGALIGVPTMVVSVAVAMVVSEVALAPLNFFIQANVTALAGAFVARWSTRFMMDDEEGGGG